MHTATDLLDLQYVLFSIVSDVARARGLDELTRKVDVDVTKSNDAAAVYSYAQRLSDRDLQDVQVRLARAYVATLDASLRAQFSPSSQPNDLAAITAHRRPHKRADEPRELPRVALVSLPWQSPAMPSIQLATLSASLAASGIQSDRHELFVDYGSLIGLELFKMMGNTLPFTAEWIFARQYFGPECGDYLHEFWDEQPASGMFSHDMETQLLDVLGPLTARFLQKVLLSIDWAAYDVVGFSLTISQTGPSLALARLIKRAHPSTTIVFGGASCAGVMGEAILRLTPYVDAVVHIEGEDIFPEVVRRIRAGTSLEGLPGVSSKGGGRSPLPANLIPLYQSRHERPPLDYHPYFERLIENDVADRLQVWIPFEGSRGCWWGEKAQCTFCGLHEIMKYRNWTAADVIHELDYLYQQHGIERFFAVDLVLPKEFHESLLPQLGERTDKWLIFYEVKADMSRADAERLAAAGVRWIQPGIESLDQDLLRLIRKGTTTFHNLQLLRWCEELGIKTSWNLLTSIPGATVEMYERMMRAMPLFFHLDAPHGCGDVQLHRFSPYFDHSAGADVRYLGPHKLYRSVFPIPEDDLRDLVYLHEWDFDGAASLADVRTDVERVVSDWRAARARGAALDLLAGAHGGAVISDTRHTAEAALTELTASEAALYRHLDTARSRRTLIDEFALTDPDAFRRLGGAEGVDVAINLWVAAGVAYEERGRVLALAVDGERRLDADASSAEIPYL